MRCLADNRVPYSMHGPTQCTVDFCGRPTKKLTFKKLNKIAFNKSITKIVKELNIQIVKKYFILKDII
jgi:hypothetical protein